MAPDPLRVLAARPEVTRALEGGRDAVDQVLWNRTARARGKALTAESTVLGAWANAAFEGAEVGINGLRRGLAEDSPIGLVAARTLAMYGELPAAADIVSTAPLQALAQLHVIVAVGGTPEDTLGRPRSWDDPDDPLRLRTAIPAAELAQRLGGVAELLTADAPALLIAALVHAELAVTQPFARCSGLVARAMTRLVLRARGVDPDGWTIPEAGLRLLGRPKYVAALRGYATGSAEGVERWLVVHSDLVASGARAAVDLVDDLPAD